MQSAVKTYRILAADKLDTQAESFILKGIYQNLCQSLIKDGYGSEQIRKMCLSYSSYLKQMKEENAKTFLADVLPAEIKNNPLKEELTEEKYLEYMRKENLSALKSLYLKIDTETLNEMLELGFSEREVSEAYANNNLFSDIIQDTTLQSIFENDVYILLHSKREEIIEEQIEEGTEEYIRLIKTVPAGPENESPENDYNIFREGNAIISLMLTKRSSPETIRQILLKHSPYKGNNREVYVNKLIDQCQRVKRAYLQIKSTSPVLDDAVDIVDIYRCYAKNYMKQNDLYFLNYDNDYEILEALRADMIPEEYLKPAFMDGSPVAIQPGRNKENYIESLFFENRENSKILPLQNDNSYLTVEDIYRGLVENADRELKATGIVDGINRSRTYYDCLIAYELIKDNHFEFKDVRKVIEQNDPSSSNNKGRSEAILDTVSEIISQEQNLLKLPDKPINLRKGISYQEATEEYTPKEIFKAVLYEHIALNPSVKNRLLNRNVNIDITESILFKFPDFDLDVLKELLESTPFGILAHQSTLPNDRNKYGFKTIKQAKERLAKHNVINDREQKLIANYASTYMAAGEGLISFSSLNSVLYRQGQSALKELNRGMNIFDIKRGIIETAEQNLINMPIEDFANMVIEKVQAVKGRMTDLQDLSYKIESPRTPDLFYKQKMNNYYSAKKKFTKDSDIAAVQEMLSEGYSKAEILEVLNELSPFAIFPGNTEKYPFTVYQTAEKNIEKERAKLRGIILRPRNEKENSAEEAYSYWLNEIHEKVNLNHEARMDEAIIRVMLLEGYQDKEIENSVQLHSPAKNLQNNYSENIVKRVVDYLSTKAPETPEVIKFRKQRKVYIEKIKEQSVPLKEPKPLERPLERGLERGRERDRRNKPGT